MARMACRLERDDGARRVAIDNLVEGNIRRVLPTSVRIALEERVINRSRMGLPAFSAREIEKECLDLERRRNERKQEPDPGVKKHRVNRAVVEDESDTSQLDSSSSEDEPTGYEGEIFLANEVARQREKYNLRGLKPDQPRIYKRAFKNYNQKFPPRFQKKPAGREAQGARQAIGGPAPQMPQGPPNRLDGPRRGTLELLALANCTKGQCIQCGYDGHYMHQDACALKDKVLVDRPCTKCGKGLHQADDCPKVFQQRYSADVPKAGGANAVVNDDESLNDD